MKFSLGLVASALLAVQAVALPATTEKPSAAVEVSNNAPIHAAACPTFNYVPSLFEAYNPNVTDHFYGTDELEMLKTWVKKGYTKIITKARIFEKPVASTVPLHRLYNARIKSHFLTINSQELDNFVKTKGYVDQGVVGYMFASQICGSVPFYRLYSSKDADYVYTTSVEELNNSKSLGYTYEGVAGYVYLP